MKSAIFAVLVAVVSAFAGPRGSLPNAFLEMLGSAPAPMLAPAPMPAAAPIPAAVLAPRSRAHTEPLNATPMQTMAHQKIAGGGYQLGSPLYDEQQSQIWIEWAEQLDKRTKRNCAEQFIGALVSLCITGLFGYLYFSYIRPNDLAPLTRTSANIDVKRNQPHFSHGLCDTAECCGADRCMCFFAWCCPSVRWADTLSEDKAKLLSFWPALLIFAVLNNLRGVVCYQISAIVGLSLLVAVVYTRQQIRKRYQLEHGTCGTVCFDCLTWCCCSPCAIVQEARQAQLLSPPVPRRFALGFIQAMHNQFVLKRLKAVDNFYKEKNIPEEHVITLQIYEQRIRDSNDPFERAIPNMADEWGLEFEKEDHCQSK